MNKENLKKILSEKFNPESWRDVLTQVFGARNLSQQPQPVTNLSANSKEIAESAFELGSFNTTDDRIIGFYQINLTDKPQIWRNRVGLRELLRSIYKYDVDGALVVFVQGDKWRLSFISEIRVLNDDGTLDKKATEPKRFTYLLGKGEKTRTATDRLSLLINRPIALEDIRNAFSVETLNKEFFEKIAQSFYNLVGSTTTKGKKTTTYERIMALPSHSGEDAETRKLYQEFAVRLIGRAVFCWFLKLKKSDKGISLLPEHLLSSDAVRQNSNYYHSILEPLFFQTLNTKVDERIEDLPNGAELIPFLNGGLFEPQIEDFYDFNRNSGFSNHLNTLKIPDNWFIEFFEKLEQYNFTIDENSPTEIEMSVDPEMLGRIFENLLAEIDPDSGETARKATGSFYTPREIVNYMVDESLLIYLKSKLQTETQGFIAFGENQATLFGNEMRVQPMFEMALNENRWQGKDEELEAELRKLFSYSDNENPFNETETEILIRAIDNCKILDPACGSGAFPMGVLHRLVHLLGKLDKDNNKWKEWQKQKAFEETKKAFDEGNPKQRELRLLEINSAFTKDSTDFGRKLFLIENCIYGVDIQPVAAEISKLRCFLTLIVDETIDDTADNRGVKPLPNLEFKFVTADALLKLPPSGLFNSDSQLEKLEKIRHDYIQSYGEEKAKLKADFKQLQDEIFSEQLANFGDNQDARALALSTWKPFSHEKVDWFDSEWMFGVKAFDIVIGNPPYGAKFEDKMKKYLFDQYPLLKGQPESYEYFLYLGISYFANAKGTLSYIVPTNFIESKRAENLREYILVNGTVTTICSFRFNVWDTNAAETMIFNFTKSIKKGTKTIVTHPKSLLELNAEKNSEAFNQNDWFESFGKRFIIRSNPKILSKINKNSLCLGDIVEVSQGIIVYKTREDSEKNLYISDYQKDKSWVKLLDSKSSISKYSISWGNSYLKYGKWLWCPRDEKFFTEPKIIFGRLRNKSLKYKLIGAYDNSGFYNRDNFNNIISRNKNYDLKFILALFNSELLNYWYKSHFDNVNINPEQVRLIPIKKTDKQTQFVNLVDYILFLKELPESEQVNEYVPNSHLVEQFEELIDALVYELYFEEDFRAAEIEFLKYAERDFKSIEGLEKAEKIKVIHNAYQALRQKDNEIRNNLKLMDIRLADLIMPIKTAQ